MRPKPFSERYVVTPSGCWEWNGVRSPKGYGVAKVLGVRHKLIRAHRLSYQLHKGPIPAGMLVLHSCDNPPCVNPDHLRIGTSIDNMSDAKERGRLNFGERNPLAVVTEEIVLKIRADSPALSYREIALKYDISKPTVAQIVTRRTWRHLP